MTLVTQNVGQTWTTTKVTSTFTVASTTGPIVIQMCIRSNNQPITSCGATDNKGNTYVLRKSAIGDSNGRAAFVLDCLSPTAGVTSIVVTPVLGGSGYGGCGAVQEVQGIALLDQSTSGSWSSSPLTLTMPNPDSGSTDFVCGAISIGNNVSSQGISDPPSGYTSAAVNQSDIGNSGGGECCYRINTSAVTDSVTWAVTGGGTVTDPAVLVSYKAISTDSATVAWIV
jgi:hypothetical protein